MDRVKQIEQSIIKKYRKPIWRKFVKAIQTYDLFNQEIILQCVFLEEKILC